VGPVRARYADFGPTLAGEKLTENHPWQYPADGFPPGKSIRGVQGTRAVCRIRCVSTGAMHSDAGNASDGAGAVELLFGT
jgi:hypothetical protein